MGIKALLRQYLFTVFVIFLATVLLCGIIFVRERTQYNIDMTEYEKVGASVGEDSIILTAGKRKIVLPKPDFGFFE